MKTIKKFLHSFFFGYLTLILNIITIGGFIIAITKETYSVIVSLIAFILFLVIVLIRFLLIVRTFLLQKSEDGLHKFATYVRYSTIDGNIVDYEIHKYIQCKTYMKDSITHEYYWTGTNPPIITSDLQNVSKVIDNPGSYNKVLLEFKKPLVYNEFCVTHVKMKIDDTDQKASKHISIKVTEPVQLVSFRVDLKHLSSHKNAKLYKIKLNQPYPKPHLIHDIPFDASTRSYEYIVNNPEFGYQYKIDWS